jgi:hypothetical protein
MAADYTGIRGRLLQPRIENRLNSFTMAASERSTDARTVKQSIVLGNPQVGGIAWTRILVK